MAGEDLHALHAAQNAGAPGDMPALNSGQVPWDLIAQKMRGGANGPRGAGGSEGLPPVLKALWGMVNFNQQPFNYSTGILQLRPVEERAYFFILNTSLSQTLYVGFGQQPNSSTGVWVSPNNGFFEPYRVPQNDVWVSGSGTGAGVLITAMPNV